LGDAASLKDVRRDTWMEDMMRVKEVGVNELDVLVLLGYMLLILEAKQRMCG
jgi:hypothetical protein